MASSMTSPSATCLSSGTFVPIPPPSTIPSSSMFPTSAMPLPPLSMTPTLNILSPVLPGSQAQANLRSITLIRWGPLDNNGKGSTPGTIHHPLRKLKLTKSSIVEMEEDKASDFDYGVEYLQPKKLSKPLSFKQNRIIEGYNPDGSLRYAPTISAVNLSLSLSKNNNFIPDEQCNIYGGPEFTMFSKLPLEVRLRIWEMGLPSDRIIKINRIDYFSPDYQKEYYENGKTRGPFTIESYYPGMLGACSESRKVAMKSYKLAFAPRLAGRPIYFNFSRDILFFEDTHTLEIFTGYPFDPDRDIKKLHGDLAAIQKMIIGQEVNKITIKLLGLYENLKSVTFQEQTLVTTYGVSRLLDREALALSDLWKKKKDGGAGRGGCRCSFEEEKLLKLVAQNPVWRKGMLDM